MHSWSTSQVNHLAVHDSAGRGAVEGWSIEAAAERLLIANGSTLVDAVKRASMRDFRAEPGVGDLSWLYAVEAKLAGEKTFPNGNPDSEFCAARDRSRAGDH